MNRSIENEISGLTPSELKSFVCKTLGVGEAPLSVLVRSPEIEKHLATVAKEMELMCRIGWSPSGYSYSDFYHGFSQGRRNLCSRIAPVCDPISFLKVQQGVARIGFQIRAERVFNPLSQRGQDPFEQGFDHAFNLVWEDQFTRGLATALIESWKPVLHKHYRPEQVKDFFRFLLTWVE